MEGVFITGVLLLCVMLTLLTVNELTHVLCKDRECSGAGLVTIIPLRKGDARAQVRIRRLISQLRWTDEALVGTILLLDVDADQALLEHCTQLCESYDFMRLVKLEHRRTGCSVSCLHSPVFRQKCPQCVLRAMFMLLPSCASAP